MARRVRRARVASFGCGSLPLLLQYGMLPIGRDQHAFSPRIAQHKDKHVQVLAGCTVSCLLALPLPAAAQLSASTVEVRSAAVELLGKGIQQPEQVP